MIEMPVRVLPCLDNHGATQFQLVDRVGHIICDTFHATKMDIDSNLKHMQDIADTLNATGPVSTASAPVPAFGTRAYTVKEIDALRIACRKREGERIPTSLGFNPLKHIVPVAEIEEIVRTHMLAGHTAEDLLASEKGEATP